jgi:hypothetical protein
MPIWAGRRYRPRAPSRPGCAFGPVRQAAFCRAVRTGDPLRRTGFPVSPSDRARCGERRRRAGRPAGLCRNLPARAAARPAPASASQSRPARTLRRFAETRGEAFYEGELAEAIAAFGAGAWRGADGDDLAATELTGAAPFRGLRRCRAARDPAQRAGHRRTDGAGHPRPIPAIRDLDADDPRRFTCRSRR